MEKRMDKVSKDGVLSGEALTRLVGRAALPPVGVARFAVSWGSRLTALVGTTPITIWPPTDMFILLNGSFGIGKSTVAHELRAAIPGAAIYDPEPIGLVLMRLAFQPVSDFQDLPRWRRWTILAAKAVAAYRSTVIIPMAFSNLAYLDEIRHGLVLTGRPVRHFCLTAPLEVVQQRLAGRGHAVDDPKCAWVHRRAIECVEAHRSTQFVEHVPTESRSPAEIARQIVARLPAVR